MMPNRPCVPSAERGASRRVSLRADDSEAPERLAPERRSPRVSWASEEELVTMLGEELRNLCEHRAAVEHVASCPAKPCAHSEVDVGLGTVTEHPGEEIAARGAPHADVGSDEFDSPSTPISSPLPKDVSTSSPSTVTFFWEQRWTQISELIDRGLEHDPGQLQTAS